MDYAPLMDSKRERLAEIESIMGHGDFYSDAKKAGEISQEYNILKKALANWDTFQRAQANLVENRELVKSGDPELAEMAGEEIPELEKQIEELELEIQYALLPRDATELRDAIVEIRAGTGGDEASLFAAELMRMYQRFAETIGWKCEVMEASPSDVGGFKEVTMQVTGSEVFRHLKYESGVHRVQRVPATETQGRIHTSTATVAVLPEAEEVDVELKKEELNVQTTRSGGPGGQHVNTTDTCGRSCSSASSRRRPRSILRSGAA